MKKVVLVFEDSRELDFIKESLNENGYQVFISVNLKHALTFAKQITPDLIVLNTLDTESEIHQFCEKLKTIHILSLIELEDYLKTSSKEHFITKPVRPKLLLSLIRSLLNNEEINWLPSFQ